jgi:hypothetical protein
MREGAMRTGFRRFLYRFRIVRIGLVSRAYCSRIAAAYSPGPIL